MFRTLGIYAYQAIPTRGPLKRKAGKKTARFLDGRTKGDTMAVVIGEEPGCAVIESRD